jgi:delta24-sterol reductase
MATHDDRVAVICEEVRRFYERGEKFRIYHGSTNSTRRSKRRRSEVVDTSGLDHVLQVDTEKRIIVVEPNVPMDKLVQATLQHNLLPPVVPEFPGITVGGAVVGSAGESSSFKYGLVDRTVESVQIVLANGEAVTASAIENADLFEGIGSSFGTLGVLTQVTMRLIPAKHHVAVTYHSATSFQDACQKLLDFSVEPDVDFVDGIVFKRDKAIIVTGKYTDAKEGQQIQTFSRAWDQWFYIHARRQFSTSTTPKSDIVPVTDYLFRYDRGGFWVGRFAFKYFCVPFDRFSRFLVDRFMHTRVMYQALHESGLGEEYIVQDLALPRERAAEFLEYAFGDLKVSPLWICPLQKRPTAVMNPRTTSEKIRTANDSESSLVESALEKGYPEIINVGVWGQGSRNRDKFIEVNRQLETRVRDLGGIKWLYAQTFYTDDEFWSIYDRKAYDALRSKYYATGLPTVYDKVNLDVEAEKKARASATFFERFKSGLKSIWPIRGAYGVLRTLIGTEYLLDRSKKKKD